MARSYDSPTSAFAQVREFRMQLMFDLDGTLTDSRVGITKCIQHALAKAGMVPPSVAELTRYVGPPLPGCFAVLLGTSDAQQIEGAIASYRSRYEQVGMFENSLYPGIAEMLESFSRAGHDLYVVTAKPRFYANQILERFSIASLFRIVHGPELGARAYTKESLIREICMAASVRVERTIMVGDRAEDVLGAKSNGLGSVAVTWGYGDHEELQAARPDCIVTSTSELVEYIGRAV